MQYSISNLNIFIILITIGFSLFNYINNSKEFQNLLEINNSPIQLISQLKGYFYINPYLALSLTITIFSFVGIPPLVGFFGKQMVLSAALDNGLVFISLIAILTSVIGGVYYLTIIKEMFFSESEYKVNKVLKELTMKGNLESAPANGSGLGGVSNITFNYKNITLSSPITFIISTITLIIMLFLFLNKE